VRVPALIAVDWGFVGAVAAIAGVVVAIVAIVAGVIVYRKNRTDMTKTVVSVAAEVDQSGMVHVTINKSGQPDVHVRDVKVFRSGTNENVRIKSRVPTGDFDISGSTAKDCYIQIDGAAVGNGVIDQGIDVAVWTGPKARYLATAIKTAQGFFIKVPDGVRLQ
jgi:hypothetical protein